MCTSENCGNNAIACGQSWAGGSLLKMWRKVATMTALNSVHVGYNPVARGLSLVIEWDCFETELPLTWELQNPGIVVFIQNLVSSSGAADFSVICMHMYECVYGSNRCTCLIPRLEVVRTDSLGSWYEFSVCKASASTFYCHLPCWSLDRPSSKWPCRLSEQTSSFLASSLFCMQILKSNLMQALMNRWVGKSMSECIWTVHQQRSFANKEGRLHSVHRCLFAMRTWTALVRYQEDKALMRVFWNPVLCWKYMWNVVHHKRCSLIASRIRPHTHECWCVVMAILVNDCYRREKSDSWYTFEYFPHIDCWCAKWNNASQGSRTWRMASRWYQLVVDPCHQFAVKTISSDDEARICQILKDEKVEMTLKRKPRGLTRQDQMNAQSAFSSDIERLLPEERSLSSRSSATTEEHPGALYPYRTSRVVRNSIFVMEYAMDSEWRHYLFVDGVLEPCICCELPSKRVNVVSCKMGYRVCLQALTVSVIISIWHHACLQCRAIAWLGTAFAFRYCNNRYGFRNR